MNSAYLSPLANHLWQSTLFAAIAGLLTLFLRNNRARSRHWVWLAASWKFLIPFSVLTSMGSHIHWRTAPRRFGLTFHREQKEMPAYAPADNGLDLLSAVREQLGLELQTRKARVDVLVIDHIEQTPTPN